MLLQLKEKKFIWIGGGVVLALLLVGGAFALGRRTNSTQVVSTPTPATTSSPLATKSPSPSPISTSVTPVTDAGVTWLSPPEKLSDLNLLVLNTKDYTPSNEVPLVYYKVGTDNGKDIIIATAPYPGMGEYYQFFYFLKNGTKYELLEHHTTAKSSAYGQYDEWKLSEKINIPVNNTRKYNSISYQEKISIKGAQLTARGDYPVWYNDVIKSAATESSPLQLFTTSAYGTVYLDSQKAESGYFIQSYILRRPDNIAISYQLRPGFIGDDYIPQVTWNDGSKNKDTYRTDGILKCGSPVGIAVLPDSMANELKPAGKTNSNETVYDFTNKNNVIIKDFYDQYARDYSSEEAYKTGKLRADAISLDEYLKRHAVFAYKDVLGRYIIFNSTVYGIQAECGKPVIYLYPTKTTDVSVKVDAKITVSEPDYGTGWNVKAEPNGQLTVNGKTYDSLYWEGIGHDYPAITSGFVVKQSELVSTLETHLSQLGLTAKESADFMEFWMPKMPPTPFVRLTWFGTREMDRLAPLTVLPQPDSRIRIFLDFEGLVSPITLPAQKLSAPKRNGFTLVEWGGLLRK